MAVADRAIELDGVVKRFRGRLAVDRVGFTVRQGEIVALLGANGAGKTTLLRLLAGMTVADEGDLRVAGLDVRRRRRAAAAMIGSVLAPEQTWYPRLSGAANLAFFGALQGLDRRAARSAVARELERLDLVEHGDVPVGAFSRGMRGRLALARARLGDPPVLLLDEPGAALDVRSKALLLDMLCDERARRAVLLATHAVSEVTAVADRALVLSAGRVTRELAAPFTVADVVAALAAAADEEVATRDRGLRPA